MTSGQWDLNALEALERESADVLDVLDIPERVRRPSMHFGHGHHQHHMFHPHASHLPPPPQQPMIATHHPHHFHTHFSPGIVPGTVLVSTDDIIDLELEDHIKHCTCTCNHMGYGNFMDYQVSRMFINI